MRRRSLVGPLILILLGALFLINNLRPDLPLYDVVAVYWPFLLIAWGLIRLVEVVMDTMAGRLDAARRSFSGGEVVLIVFICLIGAGLYSAHRHGVRFGVRGLEMFGDQYEYSISQQAPAAGAQRIVIDNPRGGIRVTGADVQEVRITGQKLVRALSKSEADHTHRITPMVVAGEGGSRLVVRVNHDRIPDSRRVSVDLDVSVPRGVIVELHGRSGDCDVSDIAGAVEISSDRADVRLNKVGGNARLTLGRSGLVRAVDLKGNVDLNGRGADVELENVAGQVTINGSYSGTLAFKNIAKPLRFESQRTELRVERVPGQITMDLGEFNASNVVGPLRLKAANRDVRIQEFTEALELETERGDIELTPAKLPLPKIEARSRSGRIDLVLPAKGTFQLEASTDHGEAINEFGPDLRKEAEGRSASLKGKVGQGPTIHLTTERGNVSVRRADLGPAQATL
jgi:DUF4097 and DUF4098 domain-containing protein YvlB